MTSRQSRFSRQFEKWHLDKSRQFLCYKVSICLDFYFCLDRDSRSRLSISTLAESRSRQSRKSRHFKKVSLNAKDVLDLDLDLDWSRLSRPPCLFKSNELFHYIWICNYYIFHIFSCYSAWERKVKSRPQVVTSITRLHATNTVLAHLTISWHLRRCLTGKKKVLTSLSRLWIGSFVFGSEEKIQ
jgi:hypothetical protein